MPNETTVDEDFPNILLGYDFEKPQTRSDDTDMTKNVKLRKDRLIRLRINQTRYSEGDVVDTPDGLGIVTGVMTETAEGDDGETLEASETSPTYLVLVEDEGKQWGAYKASELSAGEFDVDVENPEQDIEEMAANSEFNQVDVFAGNFTQNQEGFFEWPQSWVDSETPARVIALKALAGMNGTFDGCVREMRGNIASPDRFCADFLDRVWGNPYWRGDSPLPGD